MSGKYSRTKGHNFERETAICLRHIWPKAKRGLQTREGGEAPDVEIPAFWIECKIGKSPNIRKAMEQATIASDGSGKMPIVVSKRDRERALVTMDIGDWIEIIGEWWELQNL